MAEGSCRWPGPGVRAEAGPPAWDPPSQTGPRRRRSGAGWAWPGGPLPPRTAAGTPAEAASRARGLPHLHHLGGQKQRRADDYNRKTGGSRGLGPTPRSLSGPPAPPPLRLTQHHPPPEKHLLPKSLRRGSQAPPGRRAGTRTAQVPLPLARAAPLWRNSPRQGCLGEPRSTLWLPSSVWDSVSAEQS